MAANRLMNVHEALEYLENLDESSEDDFWRWGFHFKGNISNFTSKRQGW